MSRIDFYFDPSCPFCWITSRWLLQVQQERDIDVTWRPFSLALKNDELGADGTDSAHGAAHRPAHEVLRVMLAAADRGASLIDLYSAFGRRNHVDRRSYDAAMIAEVLAELDLPADLADAATDGSYDERLQAEITSATDLGGTDIGVPFIAFHGEDGRAQGYFGPVLNEMPGTDEGLRLWDGLERLGTVSSFYELKRTRPQGGPDTRGTAGL